MFCNNIVYKKQICNECLDKIFFVYSPLCICCQKESLEGNTHLKCRTKYSIDKLITCFEYKGIARQAILTSKFGPKAFSLTNNLIDYALIFKEQFGLNEITKDFIITCIPSDPQRLKVRGFNLSEIIAKRFSKKLNIKYKPLLIKNKTIIPFEKLTKKERKENIKNSFALKTSKLPCKVILVDDVITTGTTLTEAGKLLKKQGVNTVWALTLCFRPFNTPYNT